MNRMTFDVTETDVGSRQLYLSNAERFGIEGIFLVRSRENKRNPDQIQVLVQYDNRKATIGTVPEDAAKQLRDAAIRNEKIRVAKWRQYGGGREPYGITLTVECADISLTGVA